MKKGTIVRNMLAKNECYFVYMGYPVKTAPGEGAAVGGYSIELVRGGWVLKKAEYYVTSLSDRRSFPIVGHMDVGIFRQKMVEEILKSMQEEKKCQNEEDAEQT